jgi:hypothetical protein
MYFNKPEPCILVKTHLMKPICLILFLTVASLTLQAQHHVVMKSGEKISGVVLGIKYDTLQIAVQRELSLIEMKYVSSIFFDEYVAYDGSLLLDEEEKAVQSGAYLIRYQMKDRDITLPPKVSVGSGDKGIVVVEITINRSGLVMKAVPGVTGSTTTNEYLLTKAMFAAQGARFEKSGVAPVSQKGTITITY